MSCNGLYEIVFEGEFFEFAFFCVFDLEVTDGGEVADDAGEFSAVVLAFW